ncbi:tRNA preQ1(34) S-adenosylmethionine ribosyltransferase-isomerase QueA [Lichenihabitans sp. PAMC28606]|uniref:tRNA preQ1(34) S-adenosylmethionine ribosyltransferase-isomerase QueA n=1 Tax=Lichenihabitans sp. PAMC28606 TaxID=2880932 RepID=UPI001D0BC410|nr:tRNA preQ1(34) S-adenosylmethionine ribosyltransferase-isomerase QueA [Lichenihabitans sp. PAMC28606]UDL95323.1 tRNA preQ1(34) S-adenosylmethionine ribosyltransferase-isomerase QueA [Lichenihabitans sp. PAMC28606]
MRIEAFDFDLPAESIALHPSQPRDAARLLVVEPREHAPSFDDRRVFDLPDLLRAGDVLVVNDTKVIPARLSGQRRRGDAVAQIDATLHKREGADLWRAFVRPAKKLAIGEQVTFMADGGQGEALVADVIDKQEGGEVLLRFAVGGAALDAAIQAVGSMPLPPYIAAKRPQDATDRDSYQTMFASDPGAVAAPTAGLHFTPKLIAALMARGIAVHRVTLHVGAGTFLPVKVDDTLDHHMHAEWGEIDAETAKALNAAHAEGRRIVSVGTTSLRILETATDEAGTIQPFSGDTSIFITPGYRFRAVDVLMTNFHLPRSTLFMLVAAFSGLSTMHDAYRHAIEAGYRFYSYGDASLLFRADASLDEGTA